MTELNNVFTAEIEFNPGQPQVRIQLATLQDLYLTVGRERTKLELEQLQTLILALQAAEVQMRSWKPGSPRWP